MLINVASRKNSKTFMAQNIFPIDVVQAGVITDAQPISLGLLNILQFLLSIAGILGIIGLIVAGGLYFFAAGDEERVALAKRSVLAAIIGIAISLGALVLVSQLAAFFS